MKLLEKQDVKMWSDPFGFLPKKLSLSLILKVEMECCSNTLLVMSVGQTLI